MPLDPLTGAEGECRDEAQIASLVEVLALASIGESTKKEYLGKWKTWTRERALRGKGPWLSQREGDEPAVKELVEFMTLRCFVYKNQSQTGGT